MTEPAPRSHATSATPSSRGWVGIVTILATAATMRAPITSVPPQVDSIRESLTLSLSQFGLLTTIPLLCFALAAPFPLSRFARRHSPDVGVFAALLILGLAMLLRSSGTVPALYAGTVFVGIGIAALNVTIPVIIRRDYPTIITRVMPVFTATLMVMSSAGAGLSIPLSRATTGDWRGGTTVWVLIVLIPLLLWLPLLRKHPVTGVSADSSGVGVLKDSRAWALTAFMGLHSATFYASIAWLPKLLIDRGYSEAEAGGLLGFAQFMGFIFTLAVPLILGRGQDQRVAIAVTAVAPTLGYLGLSLGPTALTFVYLLLLGVGHASLTLTLALIAMTAGSVARTVPLSAMVQGLGFAFAAIAPVAIGWVHEVQGDWTGALLILSALSAAQLLVGLRAGHARPNPR